MRIVRKLLAMQACLGLSIMLPACQNVRMSKDASGYLDPEAPIIERGMTNSVAPDYEYSEDAENDGIAPAMKASASTLRKAKSGDAAADSKEMKRLRIYSAALTLSVSKVEDCEKRFLKELEELGGYMLRKHSNTFDLRVPAQHFKSYLSSLREFGDVIAESQETTDVTEKVFDLNLRLKNALEAQARLRELYAKAEEVEDILRIERELNRITLQVEQMQAQLRNISKGVAYSEIGLVLHSYPKSNQRSRKRNRFNWINAIGINNMMERF